MELLKTASLVSIFYLNILILCIQGNPAFADLPLYRQRNSTLLKPIPNAESDSKIPEYEIVQVQILPKTSADDQSVIRVKLSAFGKDIHLRLERNDDFNNRSKNVKYFEANHIDSSVQLSEVIIEDDDPGTPYIDPVQMAAVTIRQGPYGKLQMDGVIGDELLIKPALMDGFLHYERNWNFSESEDKLNSTKNDTSEFFAYSSTSTENEHIVYRSSKKSKANFRIIFDDNFHINSTNDEYQDKRNLHAFPELLLMVDYDTYAMHVSHGFNDAQIRRYYVSFLNGVDLMFKTLSDPKISLVLSHIIIFKSREANPYAKSNIHNDNTALKAYSTFDNLAHDLYSVKIEQQMGETDFPEFDAVLLLTKLDMCTEELWWLCDFATAGIGHVGGACLMNHLYQKWEGIAIVEDKGGFDGILSTAHEIAHLLGAFHDDSYDYRTRFCIDKDGHIMSSKLALVRKPQWSECSIKQIRYFLSSENAACLFNRPSYQNELEGSELPGAVLSLDEQCKRFWGTRASAWDSRVCTSLHCYKPENPATRMEVLRKTVPPAAEGSFCGTNLHCRHRKCVSKYLIYSRAWNMASSNDSSEYMNSPTVTTTTSTVSTTTTSTTTVSTTEIIATTTKHPEGCLPVSGVIAYGCRLHFVWYLHEKACNILSSSINCCSTYKLFCEV